MSVEHADKVDKIINFIGQRVYVVETFDTENAMDFYRRHLSKLLAPEDYILC